MKPILTIPAAFTILLFSGCATLDTGRTSPASPQTAATGEAADSDSLQTEAAGLPGVAPGTAGKSAAGTDLWEQLRRGLRLPGAQQPAARKQITIYSRSPHHVTQVLQRGEPYLAYIYREVEQRDFPAEIALLPFVESGYDPFAYSHGRAAGLWQFIPGTGKQFGLRQDWWYDGRRDVIASTAAALDYLDKLQRQFDGDWLLALAAYNAGEGTVRKAIRKNRKAGKPADFWNLDLPGETSAYVPRLLAISAIVRQPQRYGVELPPVPTSPAFAVVDTQGQLDIGIAAELAGISTEELYRLNPGYNHWATHPDGPHLLAIPAASASGFEQQLAALPDSKRTKWVRHKIRSGETLSHIAGHYHTTVAVLRDTNQLRSTTIRTGHHLLVPVAARDASSYANSRRGLQPGGTAGTRLTYRVRTGDSLWKIARNHQVSISQVSQWNQLDAGALIKPGQQLVIWQDGRTATDGQRLRPISYTVRSGDSLYRISRKYNVSISELRRWNNLPKGKHLQPGQSLKLYVDITRLTQKGHG